MAVVVILFVVAVVVVIVAAVVAVASISAANSNVDLVQCTRRWQTRTNHTGVNMKPRVRSRALFDCPQMLPCFLPAPAAAAAEEEGRRTLAALLKFSLLNFCHGEQTQKALLADKSQSHLETAE